MRTYTSYTSGDLPLVLAFDHQSVLLRLHSSDKPPLASTHTLTPDCPNITTTSYKHKHSSRFYLLPHPFTAIITTASAVSHQPVMSSATTANAMSSRSLSRYGERVHVASHAFSRASKAGTDRSSRGGTGARQTGSTITSSATTSCCLMPASSR